MTKTKAENEKANNEEEACAIIYKDVLNLKETYESDLAHAQIYAEKALESLYSINIEVDYIQIAVPAKPPNEVKDVALAVMHLVSGIDP